VTMRDDRRRANSETSSWRPAELDVKILRLLSQGNTTDVIARRVGVSERTVRRRLRAVADDIGVDSSIEAVVHAVRHGVI
jgi:DNA-binding NarL/FixJ family response regulator